MLKKVKEGDPQWPVRSAHSDRVYEFSFLNSLLFKSSLKTNNAQPVHDQLLFGSLQADVTFPLFLQVTETGIIRAISSSPLLHVEMLLHLDFWSCFNALLIM